MARSSRRPTFWEGTTINSDTVATGLQSYEVVPAAELVDEQDREPTLTRLIGRLVVGGTPDDDESLHASNIWWGLCLGGIGDPGLPDPTDMADDRWLITGFLRWVWFTAYYPVATLPLVSIIGAPRGYQGPWEMVDFESHAMRKARTGDSLILRVNHFQLADTAGRVDLNGHVRALWKAQ